MNYSSRQAARKLGIPETTLSTYLSSGKIKPPRSITSGDMKVYLWTEADIERVRKLLPKIANGRKTRYQKLRDNRKTQAGASQPQHAKTARVGGPGAALQKKKKTTRKQKK